MTGDEYISVHSTGKLKLKGKGISDGRIDKKKKNKSKSKDVEKDEIVDNSVVLKNLEDSERAKEQVSSESKRSDKDKTARDTGVDQERDAELRLEKQALKTESERRFEEQRRKRLEEKLKRDGVKTHKQRVEELNKYLSGLSEHHDMPRIGPG